MNQPLTVRLDCNWSDAALQTIDGRPPGSHAALLRWTDAEAVDAGPPPRLATALAAALVDLGTIAFRWSGPPSWPAHEATLLRAPQQGPLRAVLDRLTNRWPTDLVLTRHATVAEALFTHDWYNQGQAALLLPDPAALTPTLRHALATNRTWTATPLPPETALLTPAVDGAALLLAASTPLVLTRVTQTVATTLDRHGIQSAAQ